MFNPPNALSLLRGPLAIFFLIENTALRLSAVFLAMLTDCIDGYLARKFKSSSKFGAFLDPIMDKFFVYFVMFVLMSEGRLLLWQISLMISRDFFLCLFGLYLSVTGGLKSCQFRSIITGKISTVMQFIVILALTAGYLLPTSFYWLFGLIGCFVFVELIQGSKEPSSTQ
jgi:CDP-diacylglycerol---glycerol-3-phosphate 3-phosphatidyltransferase